VRIVDTSVLLPAVSPSLPQHEAARTALEAAINGDRAVGICWVVVNAFLRLTTKPVAHGASVLTLDSDFARFPNLRWESPLHR